MQCPKCHHENQSGSSFCGKCGTVFDLQQQLPDAVQRRKQIRAGADMTPREKRWRQIRAGADMTPREIVEAIAPLIGIIALVVVVAIVQGSIRRREVEARLRTESVRQHGERAGQQQEVRKARDDDKLVGMEARQTMATYVRIEAGSFTMGSPEGEPGRQGQEVLHEVTLTGAFEMSLTEVTQGQYEAVMGENPSLYKNCGKNCPVENVNWHDAVRYCNKLSEQARLSSCYECSGETCEAKPGNIYACKGYRLPTEAEWEYAARAGTSTAFYSGKMSRDGNRVEPALDRIGWYVFNAVFGPRAVKGKARNAWGLYDMSGNVSEWCHDWYGHYSIGPVTDPSGPAIGSSRVNRGGGSQSLPEDCRSAHRSSNLPDIRGRLIGFRPVRSLR